MSWVIINDDKFYLHDGETLLQGLIRAGFSPKYECCQGYCGTCKTSIIEQTGTIQHTLPPLCLLADNEVLACCCVVNGTIKLANCDIDVQLPLFEMGDTSF
ncbi:MAG: 2Fe-2S iron-sulfur cluster-binding protein [Moraxella sp.]|nr:2Fe-2S iron-sulfur cluster-binding protein [Moraxella sp.]